MSLRYQGPRLATPRPRDRGHTLRYGPRGELDGSSISHGDPIRVGDRWEVAGGRTWRVVDLVGAGQGSDGEALILETDGMLTLLQSGSMHVKGAQVTRAVDDAPPVDVPGVLARARGGDANALFHAGVLHERGDRVPQDLARAEECFHRAALRGQVGAMLRLAKRLGDKTGWTKQRGIDARRWWEAAARFGLPEALFGVAAFLDAGTGGNAPNPVRAAYLREHMGWHLVLGVDWEAELSRRVAALRRHPLPADAPALAAQGRALLCTRDALGGRRDVPLAIECLEHAAALGHAGACFELAMRHAEGLLVPRDLVHAWHFLRRAVAARDPQALRFEGEVPLSLDASTTVRDALAARGLALLPTDPAGAWHWLEQAAVRWHPQASTVCARLLSLGIVVPRDAVRAWHFASFAAVGGDVEAAHLASRLAASGEVPGVGDAEAWHWLLAAKEGKHPWGYYDLAWAYEHSLHGLRSPGMAIYWYGVAGYAGAYDAYLRRGRLQLNARPGPERLKNVRESFGWAVEHGVPGAQEALDAVPPESFAARPWNAELGEHAWLRDLFDAADEHRGPDAWATVFEPQAERLAAARPYFEQLRDAPGTWHAWPQARGDELVDLYCASRLNDLMLLPFQPGQPRDDDRLIDLTTAQYVDVWRRLGFADKVPERFHPFWCEVVAVDQDDTATGIELVEVLWPAIHLGALLFSRAGVRVRAPAAVLAPDVATVSTLYWTWQRRARYATDMSAGWGHNSQWRTDFRRDYDLGDRYAYNVDVLDDGGVDLREAHPRWRDEPDLSREDAIDLLRFRCITRHVIEADGDLYPYKDFFEEPKDIAASATTPSTTSSNP